MRPALKLPVKADLVLIVDTLHHMDNRVDYLKSLVENTASGSRIAVIDYAIDAPEGPPLDFRLPAAQVVEEFKQVGYSLKQEFGFLPNQYFLIFEQGMRDPDLTGMDIPKPDEDCHWHSVQWHACNVSGIVITS